MTSLGQRLADEQQITTPREWHPAQPVTGKKMLWIAAFTISVIGFAIGLGWAWVFPIGQ